MKILGLVIIISTVLSCSNSTVYKQDIKVNEQAWDYKNQLSYELELNDIHQNYNLLINLKYLKTYSYNNIFFFVDIIDPEEVIYRDTIECPMAWPSGKWMGESSGDYIEQQLIYRPNIHFPIKGTYQVKIQQAMRDTLLKKISSIGIELQEFEEIK